ncbi:MAG: iron-containing alcohol dehydrogenase, partial [Clostridia bacterium]|nr:iron-containing alcohol dehydrogenase [Clostridia bacterium]
MKNINGLLCEKKCSCGKTHNCNIKYVFIEENAISKVKDITEGYKNIVLVADNNTYAVCGDEAKAQIADKCENVIVFETEGFLVPNEEAVEKVQKAMSDKTDLLLGIGSGVIQDLCKYVSFNAGIPYMIVATAPSMDGYASVGAAMIMNNMKITYSAHVP